MMTHHHHPNVESHVKHEIACIIQWILGILLHESPIKYLGKEFSKKVSKVRNNRYYSRVLVRRSPIGR